MARLSEGAARETGFLFSPILAATSTCQICCMRKTCSCKVKCLLLPTKLPECNWVREKPLGFVSSIARFASHSRFCTALLFGPGIGCAGGGVAHPRGLRAPQLRSFLSAAPRGVFPGAGGVGARGGLRGCRGGRGPALQPGPQLPPARACQPRGHVPPAAGRPADAARRRLPLPRRAGAPPPSRPRAAGPLRRSAPPAPRPRRRRRR
mmetsp:Transcript_54189/g.143374  ORF Transcript_54189/g.143374 Transcript_54189/m.143374 type:complete len:207 (-) Transcript_54189:689-1309(-)